MTGSLRRLAPGGAVICLLLLLGATAVQRLALQRSARPTATDSEPSLTSYRGALDQLHQGATDQALNRLRQTPHEPIVIHPETSASQTATSLFLQLGAMLCRRAEEAAAAGATEKSATLLAALGDLRFRLERAADAETPSDRQRREAVVAQLKRQEERSLARVEAIQAAPQVAQSPAPPAVLIPATIAASAHIPRELTNGLAPTVE